jgi:hypothetical protein
MTPATMDRSARLPVGCSPPVPAEVFAKAGRWISEHRVFLADVSWNWAHEEPEPFILSVYFTFERDDDGEEQETAGV